MGALASGSSSSLPLGGRERMGGSGAPLWACAAGVMCASLGLPMSSQYTLGRVMLAAPS